MWVYRGRTGLEMAKSSNDYYDNCRPASLTLLHDNYMIQTRLNFGLGERIAGPRGCGSPAGREHARAIEQHQGRDGRALAATVAIAGVAK